MKLIWTWATWHQHNQQLDPDNHYEARRWRYYSETDHYAFDDCGIWLVNARNARLI